MLARQKKRYLISIFIFLFLLVGTGVGFVLLKNSQDLRQQASGGCKPGEPYCSCNLNGQDCVLVDPDGPRKIVEQGSLENNKGIISTSFTGERPTTGGACGGVWMNEFCYMPGDEIAGGYIVVDSGRYNYPYLEKKTTYESLGFGGETVNNQTGTVQSLGEDCGGNSYRIGNNCYAFGAVVNGYLVMPNRTSGCNNSTGDYCYAHLKKIEVPYSDWQNAVDKYEDTGDYSKLEELYKKIYGISFQPGALYDPKASNADVLRAQALISALTSAEVLQKNAQEENSALEKKGNLTEEEQAIYDFNKRIIDYPDLAKNYQVLDQLNDATSQKITINNAISQMYSDLVMAKDDANLNKLANIKFKEIFGYDPSSKYGNLNGILGAFGIDPTQLDKDRDNYAKAIAEATEKQNEAIAEQNENVDKLNQEYQEYVNGQSENINDLKKAALDSGVVTESEIKNLSEEDLLALLLSKFSDISLDEAKQNADAIVTAREVSVKEQELIQDYISDQEGEDAKDNLLELYKLYVGHAPTYRMTTSELQKEIAKHNSQIALSLYAQTQDVSYLNNYFTNNFPNAPASQLTRVLGDPEALLDSIYGSALGGELYQDIVLPQKFNEAVANFSNDTGASLTSVCKEMGITNCNIDSTNATVTLSLMLDKMYGDNADVNIPELATNYSNQIYANIQEDETADFWDMVFANFAAANAAEHAGISFSDDSVLAQNLASTTAYQQEAMQDYHNAVEATKIFNASQAFQYATENRADLSDYTWGLSYGNALMADNVFNREFTIDELGLNTGQTISLTFNQLTTQIANVDVAQNIATNYATSKHYDYTGPADTRIANIALLGAENLNVLDYDYQEAESGYYTDKTLKSWGESIGGAMTYLGASYASSQMNQMALNQSLYGGDTNFEFVDPVAYAEQASEEFKATYHEDMVNDLYEEYIAVADIQNVTKLDYEQFINDPEVQRSSQELNYERLEKVVAPAAAIVVLPAMMLTGVGAPIILGAASSAFSLYQGAGMKAQSLELQRIDIESRENAIIQSYIDSGANSETIDEVRTQLDEQIETLNKQGNLMLANSAVAALTSAGGWATTLANAGQLTGTIGNIALTSGQVLTKMGQLGGIGLNTYNTINSSITAYNAFEQGNTREGITSGIGAFVSASGVAGNTFGVFGPTAFTNKIDYVLDAMNVPAGAGMDLQQVSQACFSGSDAFSEKDCTNAWIGLALSIGQNVSQVSSSYKAYRSDTDVARVTDLQKQLDAIDLEILALNGPNKNISSGLQINDLALQRSILIEQMTNIDPNVKIANLNSTEDYLAAGMRISLDLENKAQAAIDAGQDAQAMRLIEQAEMFRNKPVEVSALKDQINAIDEQINSKGLLLSTNELADLQQNRNELVTKLETVVKDLSTIDSMQKQNEIILQTVKADTAFQELNRLLAVDTQKAEIVKTYSPSNEAVAKYRTELNQDAETIKLETDADGRLKSLAVLEDSLTKLTDLETQRQALLNTSNADSEVGREVIAKLDAEIAPLQKIVDGFSTNNRSFFQKITDAISPNKASREAYYKSLDLTREAEIAKAKLIEAEQNGSATHALKEQLADINRQLIEQKYILAQDLLNPSKNFVQRIAEFIPNLQTNRQIADLKTAAQKLGTANLEIAEQITNKQAEIEKLRTEDATKNQAEIIKLENEITDLSQTARNLLKGNNALMKVDQAGEFTKYIVTEAGEKAGIKQKQLDILNQELENFETFKRSETGVEQFKIYSNTGSFKDQDIFLLAEVEAFGAGRRGTVFGALPGMGKTDVVMPFNILLKQRLTNEPQFIVFPEPKLMKPWTSDASYTPNKAFIDYVETNFGKGSVLIVRANDPNVDPLAIARAKFVITTKDVAFDLQNTDTSVGLALRNKWKNSFVHADEVDWTFNPNENYKVSGSQVALRDKPEFNLYLNAQKSVLGIDEKGNLSGKGLSSLRNLINQLETSKSIPDGIVRTSDGKGGKFADADLEKQVLSEWLGTWNGQSKIPNLDMSADISVVRERINTYLNTDTDAQTHNHRAELAMINETVNFLSRVPGEDYGVSSNTRMNGDAEEIINSIAPKEQNRDTGRSYSAVAESLLYNTLGARILGANGQIDLAKLTVGENGSEINYALLMLESKGFSLYTGTPETVAKLYQMAYGIELKVFTDSAVDDSIARFKDSDSELFTDLESQIKTRLAENKDQVFINMVSGLRSNEVALNDLVTKISTVDTNNQKYKKLILIGASGKLAEYDLVDGNLQYVRDFASTDDLNNRTAELNGKNERYIKFYEYGAHVGVDTKNNVDTSRAIGLCNGCDATTFAQGINRVRVQVETLADGGSVTKSAPMDVVWLDAPAGIKNPSIDDFATAIKDRQTINEALAEVSFKETLLRNSVDSTLADLIDLARNGKKGFLGLGAYRANQDLVVQLEIAQQKWKETTQMNYMLGSDDLSAQAKLEKTASQVAGAYEELSRLLVGSGEPAKLLATRADGAIGNNKLQLSFSGDDDYKVLGERPSYRQIVELINQSSKHLENVDIAFTNRSSQQEVVQSEIAKAGEAQANVSVRNNEENVNQNIIQRTAETISQRFNSTNFQKIIRTPVTLISSAYSAIVDFFSEEEISPEVLAQRDKAINDLKITNEDTLIALDDLKTEEEINNFIKERQSAYQALKDQFNILNTVRPSINNEEDYKTQESKFNEIVTEIETLQKQSGLNFIEINENGEISRVNEDQFKNLSTFKAKAEIQIEKLAKKTEAEKLLAEQKAIEEAKKLEQEKLAKEETERLATEQAKKEAAEKLALEEKNRLEQEAQAKLKQEQLAKEASDKAKAEEEQKAKLALEEAEKLKQAEEKAALELAKAKEAEELAKAAITKVLHSIGRNENNSLQIIPGLSTVSRNHAQLIQDGNNNLYIRDLSSTNGTYVNNQKIIAENNVLLKEGDVIFLGNPNSIGVSFKVAKDSNNQLSLKPADSSHIVDNSAVGKAKQVVNNVAKSTADALINRFNFKAAVANYNASAKSTAQNLVNQVGQAIASRLENILQPADQNLVEDSQNDGANVVSQNTVLPKLNQQNLIDVQNKINNVGDVRGSFNELLWTHNTPFSSLAAIFQSGGISSLSAEGRAYIQAENITEEEFWKRFNQQQDLRKYGKYVKRGFNARYGLSSDFGDIKFVFKPGFEQNKKGFDENLSMITDEPFVSDFFNLNGSLFKNKYTSPRNNAEFNLAGFLRGIAQSYGFNKHLSTDLKEGYNPGLGVLERPYVNPQMQIAGAVTLDDVQAILVPAHLYDQAVELAKNSGFDLKKIIKVNTGNKENYYAYDRSDSRKNSTAIRDQAIADGVMRPNRIGRITGSSVTMVTAKEAFEKEQQAYMQIMLDLELSKTTQSNNLSNEFLFNLMIEGLKKQTVKIGSQSFSVKQLFEESAGVWEKYSVEESTEMVYRQFNKYFASNLNDQQKEFFTLLISLHDLGKSMERTQKLPDHSVTVAIAKQILQKLNYSAQEINKFIALIEQDFLGDYFKNATTLDETYKKIKAQAEKYNIDPKDYLNAVYIFYMSDAGSYTRDAGGFTSLEGRVFNQNALNNGQLLLNDVNVAKFKQLEKLINSNKVAFNSLCSDCDQVRLTTQAGVEKADALTRESEALLQQAEEAKNNNDANKAQDLTTQAEAKKQEALKQLNDTRFQIVNSHGMQNQCVQLYLNAWVDTREALIRRTRADIDNAIDSVYKATVLAEKMMDSRQIEIKTNTIFGLGGEITYQPLSDEEVDEIGDLLFGNEAKNIEGLQSWATFDLGADGRFNRTVLKGSLLNLDNTVVTSQVSPIRVFLRKFAISSRQMMLLDNLKTTLSSYLTEETEDQPDVSVTPIISITVSPTPSVTPTPEPISPTPSIVPVSSTTENNINWHLILNIIGTTLSLTLFGSILGHLPIFAAPQLPEETPTAIVEEAKKEESVAPKPTSTPAPSPVLTPAPIETTEIAVEEKKTELPQPTKTVTLDTAIPDQYDVIDPFAKYEILPNGKILFTQRDEWNPVDPSILPAYTTNRNATDYLKTIELFQVEVSDRYRRASSVTYCNIYASDVTKALGVPIPRWENGEKVDANRIYNWLQEPLAQEELGWKEITAEEAQQLANQGIPTVATTPRYAVSGGTMPGHIAMIIPGNGETIDGVFYPSSAQAGNINFDDGSSTYVGFAGALNHDQEIKYFANESTYEFVQP